MAFKFSVTRRQMVLPGTASALVSKVPAAEPQWVTRVTKIIVGFNAVD